ncbi:MAG: DUF4160 domain-containing protein [Parvularculaceae bacterium]
MPTISLFFGFVVQMYWRDHPPAHIHVLYQGYEALFAIETGEIIAGELPPSAVRLIRDWIERRRPELIENWENGKLKRPFNRVPGADVE